MAARALGAPPADCLVIEDSPAGLAAGRAAGMRVIGVAKPIASDLTNADVLVNSLTSVAVLPDLGLAIRDRRQQPARPMDRADVDAVE